MARRQLTVVAIAIAIAACSGGGDGGDGAPPQDPTPIPDAAPPPAEMDAQVDAGNGGSGMTVVIAPTTPLGPNELGVIVNSDDPQSVAVGAYYAQKRAIPAANVISLSLGASWATAKTKTVPSATFAGWKTQLDAKTPANIQAYAVTFIYPSIVECMSLTSAIAFGFDSKYCSTPCATTAASPYFDSASSTPFATHAIRPAMVIAATDTAGAKALVDRGVSSDLTFPLAQGYLVRTSDAARAVRHPDLLQVSQAWNKPESLLLSYVNNATNSASDAISNKTDVLFYFTGLASVADIATNKYVPGGVADHLTSFGGQIPDSGQMSILRWLEAGATGSYGTVVEPCNYTTKFPQASVFLEHYFAGESLIEAYWKSVATPGEGLFIGEPLARPYGTASSTKNDALVIRTTSLAPGKVYRVESAPSRDGPWVTAKADVTTSHPALVTVEVPSPRAAFYRFITP